MKVAVTVCGKPFGQNPVGTVMYLAPYEARALVALKRVTYTKDEITVEVPRIPELPEKPRRTYRTRQLKAE